MKKGCTGCFSSCLIVALIILIFSVIVAVIVPDSTNEANDSSIATTNSTIENTTDTIPTETATIHTHIYSNATCIAPKKCNICSQTEGDALGHSWVDATCTNPKTCSVCSKTTGSPSSHHYADGKCTMCEKADPSDPRNIIVWIPTNGGAKYHSYSSCSNMKNPQKVTLAYAREHGFQGCARCN